MLNLVEAGAAAGRSKSSILRAIRRGALSATRDDTTGGWQIAEAELFRAFPKTESATDPGTSGNRAEDEIRTRLAVAEAELRIKDDVIADLRRRLDRADERLMALLPPPPPRGWWRRVFAA